MSPTTEQIERKIVRKLAQDVIAAGRSISVFDGEAYALKRSRNVADIMAAIGLTCEDTLIVHQDDKDPGATVYLVYGNDGFDVIADYHVSLEPLLEGATKLAEELEEQYC